MENQLIPFTKAWNTADGNYGEKTYWFNPSVAIAGLEPCKLKKNGAEINCTKIFYENSGENKKYLTLTGSPEEFFQKCKEANTAVCLLHELDRNGVSVKDFLKQSGIAT